MPWYLFVKRDTGELASEGSEVPPSLDTAVYDVQEHPARPDWTVKAWNPALKAVYDRPLPVLVDRLDDIEARFLADPDFAAVWGSLNAARRTQLRQGILRVLAGVLRSLRFRRPEDGVELD
jgi:hypothetical protein